MIVAGRGEADRKQQDMTCSKSPVADSNWGRYGYVACAVKNIILDSSKFFLYNIK